MSDLKTGDVVYLKSGGLPMTISSVEDGKATCQWFYDGKYPWETFFVDSLTKTDPKEVKLAALRNQ